MYGSDTLVKTDVMLSSFNTLLQSVNGSCTDQFMCAETTVENKQSACD